MAIKLIKNNILKNNAHQILIGFIVLLNKCNRILMFYTHAINIIIILIKTSYFKIQLAQYDPMRYE